MELACVNGTEHQWSPTGSGYYSWTSNNTCDPMPEDAPFYREEWCWKCGAHRHVTGPMPSNLELTGAVRHEQEQ